MTRARQLLVAMFVLWAPVSASAQTPPPAATPPAAGSPAAAPAGAAIEEGSTVELEYTLKDEAGTVLDSYKGQTPLTFTQGEAHLVPGLEKQLVGMHVGEQKHVILKPDEAYGPADPSAQTEVPKELLPPEGLTVGARLMARSSTGEQRPVTVKEIKDKTVVLDLNHPLAGKTLVFEIKVLGVAPPKGAEPPKAEPKSTN
jgi:FKBP-type peptidyl-prolyl cis-trans isomerase SlyD